jgi:hypothetical protein
MPAALKERPAVTPRKESEFQHFMDEWEDKLHHLGHADAHEPKQDAPVKPKKAA